MNQQPLVSIVITTRNRAGYLQRAIKSVLAQNYKNIEVIVVDDCSSDETPKVLQEFSVKNQKIHFFSNNVNLGTVKSANMGIAKAKGKYIARLDDDDFWCHPQKLEKQVDFLEKNPDYHLVGGGMIKIDENEKELARILFPRDDKDIRNIILFSNVFVHSTVVFRKDVFEKMGGYDEEFMLGFEDIELWLRFGKYGKFYNFQDLFVCYLDREFSKTISTFRSERFRRMVFLKIKMLKKYKDMYPSYQKAYVLCWFGYVYSFLPFKNKLQPVMYKIRRIIFGKLPFKTHSL